MSEPLSTIEIVLTSSVIAGVVSAFVSVWTSQRKISIENITKERKEWREKIRRKSLEVHEAFLSRNSNDLSRLKVEFSLILNPKTKDNDDIEILECIKLPDEGKELHASDLFVQKIAFLLKHDWERSKLEAGSFFCRLKYFNKLCEYIFIDPEREKSNK